MSPAFWPASTPGQQPAAQRLLERRRRRVARQRVRRPPAPTARSRRPRPMTPYRTSSAVSSSTPFVGCQASGAAGVVGALHGEQQAVGGHHARRAPCSASAPVAGQHAVLLQPVGRASASPARIACSARAWSTPAALRHGGAADRRRRSPTASGAAGVFSSHAAATNVRSASCAADRVGAGRLQPGQRPARVGAVAQQRHEPHRVERAGALVQHDRERRIEHARRPGPRRGSPGCRRGAMRRRRDRASSPGLERRQVGGQRLLPRAGGAPGGVDQQPRHDRGGGVRLREGEDAARAASWRAPRRRSRAPTRRRAARPPGRPAPAPARRRRARRAAPRRAPPGASGPSDARVRGVAQREHQRLARDCRACRPRGRRRRAPRDCSASACGGRLGGSIRHGSAVAVRRVRLPPATA